MNLNPPSASSVISGMNSYYNVAYIKVEEQTTGNTHSTFGWVRMTNLQHATADVPGDSDYWCVCVGWAYESGNTKVQKCPSSCTTHDFYSGDDDPENEGAPPGYRISTFGVAEYASAERCMIFLEIQRDRGSMSIAELVSHEVGHCLGLEHAVYSGSFNTYADGIMGWSKPGNITCYKTWYDLVWGHTSPDRLSLYHIAYLRLLAND